MTDVALPVRIYRSGLLKFFSKDEMTFVLTDICFNQIGASTYNDRAVAKMMVGKQFLRIVSLTEDDMEIIMKMYEKYKKLFTIKTISSFAYARIYGLSIISDDEIVQLTCKELNISVFNKEWLITSIVYQILALGGNIDIDLVREII